MGTARAPACYGERAIRLVVGRGLSGGGATAQLNLVVIDALLKAYGAPRLSELIRKLPLLEERVEVRLRLGDNKASETMREVLESFAKLAGGRIALSVEEGGVPPGLPAPELSIGGAMEHRLRFYGLIDGILLCPLLEALLYAGGVLEPPRESIDAERRVEVYVVPGRPCLVTLRNMVPLVPVSEKLEMLVIDARECEKTTGCKLPAPFVPAIVVNGRLARVGSVKSVDDARSLILG